MYNSVQLAQIVRVKIVESGGLYIATSADVPPMHVSSFDLRGLRDAIEDSIQRYFHSMDENVRVELAPDRGPDDLTTWEILALDDHDRSSYRDAAE